MCRATKLHSDLALRVGLKAGATLKATTLAAAFSPFRPIAAVVTCVLPTGAEGVVVFGNAEDLKNALSWQDVRIWQFGQPSPPASPQPQQAVSPQPEQETREDAALSRVAEATDAAPDKKSDEAARVAAAPAKAKRQANRGWPNDGFLWSAVKFKAVRKDRSCRMSRTCTVSGCRAVRIIEFGPDWEVSLDKTSPPHNHLPGQASAGGEKIPPDGAFWVATRTMVRDGVTITSLRCPTPDCLARRCVKLKDGDTVVADEKWGLHLHSREEREAEANKQAVELTVSRDRDEDIETLAMLRHTQQVRRYVGLSCCGFSLSNCRSARVR